MKSFDAYAANPDELARLWAPVAAREGLVYRRLWGGKLSPVEQRAVDQMAETNEAVRDLRASRHARMAASHTSGSGRSWDKHVLAMVTTMPQTSHMIADSACIGIRTATNSLRRLDAAGAVVRDEHLNLTTWRLP